MNFPLNGIQVKALNKQSLLSHSLLFEQTLVVRGKELNLDLPLK